MQEDTESFNENSSSEVIILPQNSHLETLISDDEETDAESRASYEAKLNAKLKNFGLYEDGMTIQQKEELLTVVAVSFKTAEEEKTRRQWYEEYANAALNFPEDEIEFSFQQSPDRNLSEKTASFTSDLHLNSNKSKGISSSDFDRKTSHIASATVTKESLTQNDSYNQPSTSSQNSGLKPKTPRKNRVRGEGISSFKLALDEGNTVTYHSVDGALGFKNAVLANNRHKKKLLEESMSRWRPCLSPKDEPLVRINHQVTEDSEKSCTQPSLQTRMRDYLQEFSFASSEIKKASKTPYHFGKPYHLTRSGHCLRKATKVDSIDIMIGVQEGRNEVAGTSDPAVSLNHTLRKEPFSRTSCGAFRYAQLHRDRIDGLRDSSTAMNNQNSLTNHTITRYSGPNSVEDYNRTSPEILIEDEVISDRFGSSTLHHVGSLDRAHRDDDVKISSETKLPKFSNLRPNLCREGFSGKEILSRHLSLPYTSTSCSTSSCTDGSGKAVFSAFKRENHIDPSCHDGDLSDCSSVIDVETIVDDEIEEFVIKRKLIQESTSSDKQTYSNRPKRVKKNT